MKGGGGPGKEPGAAGGLGAPGAVGARRARTIWKRALLVLLSPLVVLVAAEGVLRLVGFGYATTYFVDGPEPGTWVDNPDFGRRFFAPGLLRVPPPTRVRVAKAPGTVRVLVFGESAAMGDPKPAFGVARYLEVLLTERFPNGRFEVIPVAMTAISSHALLPMARQCAALDADHWVVFAGNNEMLGPFGAGQGLGGRLLPVPVVRCVLAARATRLGQAIEAAAQRLRGQPVGGSRWVGLRVMADENLPEDSPRRAAVYAAFERNIRDLVAVGRASGARVLLSGVAVNLADCAPFGSGFSPGTDEAGREPVLRVLADASRSLTNIVPTLDPSAIRGAASNETSHAALRYLLGRVLLAESKPADALAVLGRARDLDTIPLRTDSRQNAILQRLARELDLPWIDAEQALAAASPQGVPGREFFYEHVHFTPEGNHALARAFAEGLAPLLPEEVRAGGVSEWASAETCAHRLGLTPWGRGASAELMLRRILDAPFTQRVDQEFQVIQLAEEVSRQRRAQTPQAAAFVAGIHTNAIAAAPDDPHLRRVYAEFLEATGQWAGAAEQWRQVIQWLPHHPFAYLQAGSMLRRLGRLDEAEPLLQQAAAMQSDWVDARLELADLLLARGRPAEAVAACEQALRIQPDHARAHYRLADAQAANQQPGLALQSLEQAVKLDGRLWEARYLLGVEYALAGQVGPAREQFDAVIRLKPDHARARFNLGIALARQGQWEPAERELAEALRLDPRHQPTREALAQIEAIRRRPTPSEPQPQPQPSPLVPP